MWRRAERVGGACGRDGKRAVTTRARRRRQGRVRACGRHAAGHRRRVGGRVVATGGGGVGRRDVHGEPTWLGGVVHLL